MMSTKLNGRLKIQSVKDSRYFVDAHLLKYMYRLKEMPIERTKLKLQAWTQP